MGILFVYSNSGAKLWSRRAIPEVCAIGRVDGMLGVFCQFCEIFIGVSVSLEPLLMKIHILQMFPRKGTPWKHQYLSHFKETQGKIVLWLILHYCFFISTQTHLWGFSRVLKHQHKLWGTPLLKPLKVYLFRRKVFKYGQTSNL